MGRVRARVRARLRVGVGVRARVRLKRTVRPQRVVELAVVLSAVSPAVDAIG